ncbi:MAG: hypothetical protein OXU78_04520 [Deltaproteobacteria bacterium]|nr:hypothetical protein [Deltaproteobacteria bacterium]MDD9853202.1 hypothetical protein [Deltaproteobacteria bacterium]
MKDAESFGKMNRYSREICILKSAIDLIEGYVNRSVCFIPSIDPITQIRPNGTIEMKYFYILVLELISYIKSKELHIKKKSLLMLLKDVSRDPQLKSDRPNTDRLRKSTDAFIQWLQFEFEHGAWEMDSVDIEKPIKMSRHDALYLIGNRCKHILPRSDAILRKLREIYRENEIDGKHETDDMLLQQIDVWLMGDFDAYHFTKVCELSADVYYGIVEYVESLPRETALHITGLPIYRCPDGLDYGDETKDEYSSLLHSVGRKFIPKNIKTCESLQKKY